MSVDARIRAFARLLDRCWDDVVKASADTTHGSFVDDWLQANWEMFVEAGLGPGVFLEVYGAGADCNGASSRVWRPDAVATHRVVCRDDRGADLELGELVSLDGDWFARRPPFDHVLIEEPVRRFVSIADVVFALEPVAVRHVWNLTSEPRGAPLTSLVRALAREATSLSMIVRDELGLDTRAQELLQHLAPHLIESMRTSSWPGTELIDHTAMLHRYALDPTVIDAVLAAMDRLFGWRQPGLPEDLAFNREDGSVVLASIAHEAAAWLEMTDDECARFATLVPGLEEIITRSKP